MAGNGKVSQGMVGHGYKGRNSWTDSGLPFLTYNT